MNRLAPTLALLALPLFALAQSPAKTKKDLAAAQEVEKLERQRFAALVGKDFTFLDKAFADDLVYTHSSGKQQGKTDYLQGVREGKSVYDKIDVENINVRAYNDGQAAAVNGQIVIYQPNKPDGTPNVAHLKYVTVQIKDPKKGWQVVLWQSQKQPEAK
jgi:ketosteroid isomerase-like protein